MNILVYSNEYLGVTQFLQRAQHIKKHSNEGLCSDSILCRRNNAIYPQRTHIMKRKIPLCWLSFQIKFLI